MHRLLSLVISFPLISDISAKGLPSRYAALTNRTGAKQRRRRGTSGKLQNIQLAIFTDRSTTLITFAQDLCQRKDQGVIITKFQISLRLCSAEISRRTSLQNRPGFRNQLWWYGFRSQSWWFGFRSQLWWCGFRSHVWKVIRNLTEAMVSSVELYLNHETLGQNFAIDVGELGHSALCSLSIRWLGRSIRLSSIIVHLEIGTGLPGLPEDQQIRSYLDAFCVWQRKKRTVRWLFFVTLLDVNDLFANCMSNYIHRSLSFLKQILFQRSKVGTMPFSWQGSTCSPGVIEKPPIFKVFCFYDQCLMRARWSRKYSQCPINQIQKAKPLIAVQRKRYRSWACVCVHLSES